MEEVFETYSERPKKYYTFLIIKILYPILWVLILTHQDIADNYVFITCTLVFSGLIAIIIGMMLTITDKMYIRDGELKITPSEIYFNSVVTSINEIENIEISANNYKGSFFRFGARDGTGNKISILSKSNERSTYQFIIASRSQRNNLRQILKQWEESGVPVGQMGFARN